MSGLTLFAMLWIAVPFIGGAMMVQTRWMGLFWPGAGVMIAGVAAWVVGYLAFDAVNREADLCADRAHPAYVGPDHPDCIAARARVDRWLP
ncbi:hypothetical protein [Jannaschia ovalis]|uniref:Uncharacterized protein n=1 Tax=Jannaschia ovalis TaxID=3038773 RepID=A0ABY8LFC2_9RHOB|nr:hypothetical protein [Jannaschia sp. GRR-S6-38]WGH80004.1 hypothetical protein P8627_07020 [Jannaschia sp. GRR-S6-38]